MQIRTSQWRSTFTHANLSSKPNDAEDDHHLFHGMTAWFSESTKASSKTVWTNHNGELEGEETALYVFSDDATAPDTIKLFQSRAYVQEHLAILHTDFIAECVKLGQVQKVVAGKYILLPSNIQKQKESFAATEHSTKHLPREVEDQDNSIDVHDISVKENKSSSLPVLYELDMSQASGPLEEFIAGRNGCEVLRLQ